MDPYASYAQEAAVAHLESHARRAIRDSVPMAPLIGEHARLRPLLPVLERDGEVVERIIELLEEKVLISVHGRGMRESQELRISGVLRGTICSNACSGKAPST